MTEPSIRDVSDTARWVAAYRAIESERPDALYRDRLAARLAGPEGVTMTATGPSMWPTVVRTKLIDDLILDSIAAGCDRVVNLAAGLDTRPFRLELPAELNWYEADLPDLLGYKESVLASETPNCRRVTRALDVTDTAALTAFLDEATEGAQNTLVLTEGLLPYLPPAEVATLRDALRRPDIRWWAMDHWSPGMLRMVNLTLGRKLASARWQFAAPLDFFRGWTVDSAASVFRAAALAKRSQPVLRGSAWTPEHAIGPLEKSLLWCGAVRFTHSGARAER
ncbi:class I SAM-dependent methyltransferase [Nocardia sp. NPDC055321]